MSLTDLYLQKSEHGTRQSGLYGPVEYSMIFQGASVCSSGQQLQFQSPYQGFVAVRDQAKCGDTFLVYDNGVLLGSTSDPGCYTAVDVRHPFCSCSLSLSVFSSHRPRRQCEAGVNGGDSFDRACISRGCFLLAPNVQHNITIVLSFSPYGSSEVGADVAYYADSPGADCSQSAQALAPLGPLENLALNQCTSLPVVAGTSPCPPFQQLPTPVGCPTFPVE